MSTTFHFMFLFFFLLQIIVSLGRLLAYPPSLFFPLAWPPAPVDGHGRQKHVVELNEQENGSSCSPPVYYRSWETFFFQHHAACCRAVAGACFDDRAGAAGGGQHGAAELAGDGISCCNARHSIFLQPRPKLRLGWKSYKAVELSHAICHLCFEH